MLDFLSVASEIVRGNPELAACRPVIEKELLHFEILGAMSDAGLLRQLTFKGGTCLRLCHGGLRFSEDLDFSGGEGLDDPEFLGGIEDVLRERIGRNYGLEVTVKPPREDRDGQKREVGRWLARIVTHPAKSSARLGVQRIKMEIDRRVHEPRDMEHLAVQQRYDLVQDYFTPFPIRAASLLDICTDKMIAFPLSVLTRENPRHRDIWDIVWIRRRIDVDSADGLAARSAEKAVARRLAEQYNEALVTTVEKCEHIIASTTFVETLQRFIPRSLAIRTVSDAGFQQHLITTIQSLCEDTLRALDQRSGLGLKRPGE